MTRLAPLVLACAMPATAVGQAFTCTVSTDCSGPSDCAPDVLEIGFAIDRGQFAASVDPADPPRVKRTTVTVGRAVFVAEPFIIGATHGFWEDAGALGQRMLTVAPDGAATYSETATGARMTGRCEVSE